MTVIKYENIRNMSNSTSNPYLQQSHVRNSYYNGDKSAQTVSWNCWPKEYQYAYSYSKKMRYGYLSGGTPSERGGILRYFGSTPSESSPGSGYYVLPEVTRNVRRGVFEGIRIRNIKWKTSDDSGWKSKSYENVNNYNDATISVSSSKNGLAVDLEVTYELCTMGFPHRDVPFFFFSRSGSGAMANGSQFNHSTPGKSPGEAYSKVSSAWGLLSYDWGDPRVTCKDNNGNNTNNKTKAGWAYKNANTNDGLFDSHRTDYGPKNTYEYQTKKPYLSHEGWISDTPYAPQYARKSTYWTYTRVYKDRFIFSGIVDKPKELGPPNKAVIQVKTNHCSSDLRGEEGTVTVKYTHNNGNGGYVHLFAVQKESSNNYIIKAVYKNVNFNNNESWNYNVDFKKLGLIRSKEVRYYADSYTHDPNYTDKGVSSFSGNPWGSSSEKDTFWSTCAKGHYFNEEPYISSPYFETTGDSNVKTRLSWKGVVDPDSDSVKYNVYIARENDEHNNQSEHFWGNVSSGVYKYEKKISNITTNYCDIDMKGYDYGENIRAWVKVFDNYINSYYYSSVPASISKTKAPVVTITTSLIVSDENNSFSGSKMIDGTRGKITVKYRHDEGIPGVVDVDAYQATDSSGANGHLFKLIKKLNFDNTMINSNQKEYSQTFEIDFISLGFIRSRDIRYIGKGIDEKGIKSYSESSLNWDNSIKGHHFNNEPEPTSPWIENLDSMSSDERVELKWNIPKDPDNDTDLHYNIYLKHEDDSKNTKSRTFYGPYINGIHKYYKEFITSEPYLTIDLLNYVDKRMSVWIESHDNYANNYYYSGQQLPFENAGIAPNSPKVLTQYAHGEEGDLAIQYSHNTNKNGYVSLYAICKYLNGSKKTFTIFEDRYAINGESMQLTIDFVKTFGKLPTNRSCEIRYYATARTQGYDAEDTSTVPPGWTPNTGMWEEWVGGHYFNEEPPKPVLVLDKDKTNLYTNAYFTWNETPDPDDDNVKYQVFFRAKSAIYSYKDKYVYFYGQNKEEDLAMYCDMIAETTNTFINLDLTHFEKIDDEFDLWIRPWDTYHNSYYYNSDVIHFKKLEYSRPQVSISVNNSRGEEGSLSITYTHPDASLPPEHEDYRDNTDGIIKLYAYAQGLEHSPTDITYLLNGNESTDACLFINNQSKTITVNFSNDLKCSRSRDISYFAIARDVNEDPGLYSTDYKYDSVPDSERYYGHYFNGIPIAPQPINGKPDTEDDKKIYDFIYTNIIWDEIHDPDDDIVDYHLYLKTPKALNEALITSNFTYNGTSISRQYTREYKIESKTDDLTNKVSHYEYSMYENGSYRKLYDKDKLSFRLDYLKNPIDWPESTNNKDGLYSFWIVSKDRYKNSYYNSSQEIVRERGQHEKPNKVDIACTPAHGEEGEMRIKYSHPENLDANINLYAYMNEETTPILIDTLAATFTPEQIFDHESTGTDIFIEFNHKVKFTNNLELKRSNDICYYAVAIDTLVGNASEDRPLDQIPYSEKAAGHYYNEEPPAVFPVLLSSMANDFNLENVEYEKIPYNKITLVWKKVVDPDTDNVNYTIYMDGESDNYESKSKDFYGDYNESLKLGEFGYSEDEEYYNSQLDAYGTDISVTEDLNLKTEAKGHLEYNYEKKITPNMINDSNVITHKVTGEQYIFYTFDIQYYKEKTSINIWIETDDNYENSYYRSGKILITQKGHETDKISTAWPKSYSTIYSKTPRIVIKLTQDSLIQETKVFWKDTWYSNSNPEHVIYFSGPPKATVTDDGKEDLYVIFRPPVSQSAVHHSKITFAIKTNNGCSESEPKWFECMYNKFGNDFTSKKFIPLKCDHVNIFRLALQKVIDAYGKDYLSDSNFIVKDKIVSRNDIIDNNDYNELAIPLRNLNNYINTIDNSLNIDNDNNVIIKEDFDLIEYEESMDENYMTSDYKEWKILLYLIQNM